MNTFNKVYNLALKIPQGKVSTYARVAKHLGISPLVVGYALHANKDFNNVPCHRVINSKGRVSKGYAFGGPNAQIQLLKAEGVIFDKNGNTDLGKFGYFLF